MLVAAVMQRCHARPWLELFIEAAGFVHAIDRSWSKIFLGISVAATETGAIMKRYALRMG